jgi:hypothetical protein
LTHSCFRYKADESILKPHQKNTAHFERYVSGISKIIENQQ